MRKNPDVNQTCSIARCLEVVGERWTLLIVREALITGTTRFQDFKDSLGIAGNVLSDRLGRLVDEGVMERRSYREDGSRERSEYVLTESGRTLHLVIAGLSQWGRTNRPRTDGTSPRYSIADPAGQEVVLAFVTPEGRPVRPAELVATRTDDSAL